MKVGGFCIGNILFFCLFFVDSHFELCYFGQNFINNISGKGYFIMDYEEIVEQKPDLKLIDGHLVDIQGTLIGVFDGKLNQPLYEAMLEAYDKGEKIYIYSSVPAADYLQKFGVDTDKFPLMSKSSFKGNWCDEHKTYYIVTGKIVDDAHPKYQGLNIILTNENAYLYPNQQSYSFERTPMSDDLKKYYLQNQREVELREKLNALKYAEDPLDEKAYRFRRAERDYALKLAKNHPNPEKKRFYDLREDIWQNLTKEEKARIHLETLREEYRKKQQNKANSSQNVMSAINNPKNFMER